MEINTTESIAFITLGMSVVAGWFGFKYGIDRLNEKFTEHKKDDDDNHSEAKRQLEAIWKWKDEHEKESTKTREHFYTAIAEVKSANLVTETKFLQVLKILEDIKLDIADLKKQR